MIHAKPPADTPVRKCFEQFPIYRRYDEVL